MLNGNLCRLVVKYKPAMLFFVFGNSLAWAYVGSTLKLSPDFELLFPRQEITLATIPVIFLAWGYYLSVIKDVGVFSRKSFFTLHNPFVIYASLASLILTPAFILKVLGVISLDSFFSLGAYLYSLFIVICAFVLFKSYRHIFAFISRVPPRTFEEFLLLLIAIIVLETVAAFCLKYIYLSWSIKHVKMDTFVYFILYNTLNFYLYLIVLFCLKIKRLIYVSKK